MSKKKRKKKNSKKTKSKLKRKKRKPSKLRKKRSKKTAKKIRKIRQSRAKLKKIKASQITARSTEFIKKTKNSLTSKFKKVLKEIKIQLNFKKKIEDLIKDISKKIQKAKRDKIAKAEQERKQKLRLMRLEKIAAIKEAKKAKELEVLEKQKELREELRFEKDRKRELQKFLKAEQALVRKEQAEKQRKFLEQLKLEKKIEAFRKREVQEIKALEKYVLQQERENYSEVQDRINKIKEKYQAIRDQKIRERVQQLGVNILEGDTREDLLEKEKQYHIERQKIEFALESFYRSAHSLCYQINKRYIPKYLSILRVIDRRFESGEIFIKWDDRPDEDWLMLIYIKNNKPDEGIIIEDKTDQEKNISHEFKANEIFKASDVMVDSITQLLDRERKAKKAS